MFAPGKDKYYGNKQRRSIMISHFLQDNWKIIAGITTAFLIGFRYVFHFGREMGIFKTEIRNLKEGQKELKALLIEAIKAK